jgi:hypothetical protein
MESMRSSHNLLRHDGTIVINEMRSVFSSWTDRLLAIAILPIALVAIHRSLAHRPFVVAASVVSALAVIVGGGAARLIHHRLEFHAYDGVLAIDAMAPRSRRHYRAACHVLALSGLCVAVLVARPGLVAFGVAGYLAGTTISLLATRLTVQQGILRRFAISRTIRVYLQRPRAGIPAAILVLFVLLSARTLDAGPRSALTGIITVAAVLSLTSLDDAVIRFMTISGYRAWSIAGLRARGALILLAITTPICLIASERLVAVIVGAIVLGGLVLMTMRILVYRIHARRAADMIVSVCVAVVCITGFAAPLLLPLTTAAIFWQLHRGSRAKTWMLT